MIWGIFLLSYLSVVNLNIHYNGDIDFTLMMPFQMTQRSMTLTLTFVLKIAFSDLVV